MVVVQPAFRRHKLLAVPTLLLAFLVGGCAVSDTAVRVAHSAAGTSTPPASPSGPMPTTSAGIQQRACTDIAALQQSVTDLKTAQDHRDLPAGQQAWRSLTNAMTDLTATMQSAASDAGIAITDVLGPIVDAIGNMDSMAKLTAVGTALKATGPALDAAANHAKSKMSCA
jgi:hypothetical protein